MSTTPSANRSALTLVTWLVCIIAAIGFAFDIYELLMLPLIIRPALRELGGIEPGTHQFFVWFSLLFYVPAVAGGIFGLLGGYLTDKFGRRRVLTWSILIYAFSAFAAGFSTSLPMLLVLRTTTFVGVCIEFVAAVAWLAEMFADRAQRERVLGYTQAFSSLGGLLVAGANGLALKYHDQLPAIELPALLTGFLGGKLPESHAAWRYTLMSGLIPAIPLILIRPFLPESPIWQAKRSAGTLKRPSFRALFSPELRTTTIVTTLMFACSYGAAFGAIQHMPQIIPRFTEVKAATEGLSPREAALVVQKAAPQYATAQEIGGLIGRLLFVELAVLILSRRTQLRIFQIPGLLFMPVIFWAFGTQNNIVLFHVGFPLTLMHLGIFFCGLVTVAQFTFWGNYLPHAYPLHLRGTGESFAANVGGRMIGTSFAAVTAWLATQPWIPGAPPTKTAFAAAGVALFVYLVGSIACFWLPEPRRDLSE
jgi:MFS family permease